MSVVDDAFAAVPVAEWTAPRPRPRYVPSMVAPPPMTPEQSHNQRLIDEADARAERIITILDNGASWSDAAAELGISRSAVGEALRRYRRRYGGDAGAAARETERQRAVDERNAEIIRMAAAGVARSAIATFVGCGIGCVHRALREDAA